VSIFIVFSGGVVRVTGSGLGCPTWPACEPGSLTTTPALGIHGLIEFGNRSLTGLLIVAVGFAIVATRLQGTRNRTLTRLAWSQFWLVVVNSIAGGVSVLTGLNPYVVAVHFVLAIALLTTTTLTWHRARQSAGVSLPAVRAGSSGVTASRVSAGLSVALVVTTLALIMVGTLVTGSGQHSGDSADVARMSFVWADVTVAHAVLGSAVIALAVVLLLTLRGAASNPLARRRVLAFLVVTIAQALIGVIQALTGVPAVLVAIHVLGSALVWVGVLRVLLDVNPGLFSTVRASAGETTPEVVAR
jgi:cytochrome c oxidase assembly protein subunit 15